MSANPQDDEDKFEDQPLEVEKDTEVYKSSTSICCCFRKAEPQEVKSISVTKSTNDEAMTAQTEIAKLRIALVDKWIDYKKLKVMLDVDRDGIVTYHEFYDIMSQFGFAHSVDLKKAFSHVDTNNIGVAAVEDLLQALKVKQTEIKPDRESQLREFPTFPETLLVALVAHNNMKPSMMKFVSDNLSFFKGVKLVTTGSTGRSLVSLGLTVDALVSSGPLGGDQEIGGMISTGEVAAVFFFQDPLSAHPHKPDIRALSRICCVHNVLFASNPSTAYALVYSLECSAFGVSHLMGMNPKQREDSGIVKNYKSKQTKVIKKVSDDNGIKNRTSLALRGAQSRNRGSIIYAP